MDTELQAKVDRIKELVDERETREFDELYDAWTRWVLQNPIGAPDEPQRSDIASTVDVDAIFQPLVNIPAPDTFTWMLDLITGASRDVTLAWNELLTQLAANSVNWTGLAGDAFNRHTSSITYASWEHQVLLSDLVNLYSSYQALAVEVRLAAHDFADKIIKVLSEDNSQQLSWTAISILAISVLMIVATELAPPVGAALWVTRAANVGAYLVAGEAVLNGGATIGGPVTVKGIMNTVADAAALLDSGVRAKAEAMADLFEMVPSMISAAAGEVIPRPPNLPE